MLKVLAFYVVFTPATTLLGSYLADTLMWNEYLGTNSEEHPMLKEHIKSIFISSPKY